MEAIATLAVSLSANVTMLEAGVMKSSTAETRYFADSSSLVAAFALAIENFI